MGDPKFSPHADIPRSNYLFTGTGWLWKLDMKVDAIGKVILRDAAGLTIQSRNMIVFPTARQFSKEQRQLILTAR